MTWTDEKPFRPHPLLRNGHAMTIVAAFLRRRFVLPRAEERCFQVDADSRLLGHCHWQEGKDRAAPVLVLVHGLDGSSASNYMLGIGENAWERRFHGIRLNQRHFVSGLMSRYARKVELFPQRYSPNGFGRIGTVREFDDAITAPQFGYSDAQEYYEAAGAKCVIDRIRVPLLLITAQDDPFVPFEATLASGVEKNPAIVFKTPEHGGHCGFISDESG